MNENMEPQWVVLFTLVDGSQQAWGPFDSSREAHRWEDSYSDAPDGARCLITPMWAPMMRETRIG